MILTEHEVSRHAGLSLQPRGKKHEEPLNNSLTEGIIFQNSKEITMKTTHCAAQIIETGGPLPGFLLLFLWLFCLPALAQEERDENPPEPCPKPYVKTISPLAAKPLTEVKIRGSRLGDEPGAVTFTPDVGGKIISWSNKRIFVEVPEEAQTGPVAVTSSCGSVSNSHYFTVIERKEEYSEHDPEQTEPVGREQQDDPWDQDNEEVQPDDPWQEEQYNEPSPRDQLGDYEEETETY